jgi:hypothetical protein
VLGKTRRFRRVGHRAQRVDDAGVEPGGPILEAVLACLLRVRRSRDGDRSGLALLLHRVSKAPHERGQAIQTEATPFIRKRIGVREEIVTFGRVEFTAAWRRQPGTQRCGELADRGATVIESIARIPRVVEVHAVQLIAAGEIADHGNGVVRGGGDQRRGVQPFDPRGLRTRPAGELAEVRGAVRADLRELLREIARHHQPLGMTMHEMFACVGQVGGARYEVDVHPRVDAEVRGTGGLDHGRQRIERLGLTGELGRARLETRLEVRIAASANLHEQRVESVIARGLDEPTYAGGRGKGGAEYPERPDFTVRCPSGARCGL